MPLSTRGRKRDKIMSVPVSTTLRYAFKTADLSQITGVSAGDLAALGQTPVESGSGLIVFSPQAPKPALFRKKLSVGGLQGSVSTFGNGVTTSAIKAAAGAGWKMSKGVRRCGFGNSLTQTCVGIKTANGLIVKRFVPNADAGNASVLGWEMAVSSADLDKLVSAPEGAKVARVKQDGAQGSKTLPCSGNKVADALAAGWILVNSEYGFEVAAAE